MQGKVKQSKARQAMPNKGKAQPPTALRPLISQHVFHGCVITQDHWLISTATPHRLRVCVCLGSVVYKTFMCCVHISLSLLKFVGCIQTRSRRDNRQSSDCYMLSTCCQHADPSLESPCYMCLTTSLWQWNKLLVFH